MRRMKYLNFFPVKLSMQREAFHDFPPSLSETFFEYQSMNFFRRMWLVRRGYYPAKSGILQSPSCVCLFACLFVSRISHKLLVGFWLNLVSREVIWWVGRNKKTEFKVGRDPDWNRDLRSGSMFLIKYLSDFDELWWVGRQWPFGPNFEIRPKLFRYIT